MSTIHCSFRSQTLGKSNPFIMVMPEEGTPYTLPSLEPRLVFGLHALSAGYEQLYAKTPIQFFADTYNMTFVLPQADRSFYLNGVYPYEDYITAELPDYLDRHFKLPDRSRWSVLGVSMGGYGAANLYAKHPGLFSSCASFSGAFDIPLMQELSKADPYRVGQESLDPILQESFDSLFDRTFPKNGKIALFCGKSDFLYPSNLRLAEKLEKEGVEAHIHFEEGDHDWIFWSSVFEEGLRFLQGVNPEK